MLTHWQWSIMILQLAVILPTDAMHEDFLALRIVPLSPTLVHVEWNCSSVDSHNLTWATSLDDEQEQWQRTDDEVFNLCQDSNNTDQLVSTSISDLEEDASYNFSLVAMNDSFTKSMATIKTLPSAPSGPPIHLRGHPTNPSGMVVSWNEPRLLDRNGQITGYVITMSNRSDEQSVVVRCDKGRTATGGDWEDCLSSRHSMTLSNLVPYVVYDVRVAAMNANGTGPMSDLIILMSGEDKPGPPQNLRVVNFGDTNFVLQWNEPENPNGAILGYKLEYGLQNQTSVQIPLSRKATSYPLNLMVNQTYAIRMYASNSVGMGPAEMITWPMPVMSTEERENKAADSKIIIGVSVGGVVLLLIVIITIIVCVRIGCKKCGKTPKEESTRRRVQTSLFYPVTAITNRFGTATVVNEGYAATGPPTLSYDYPYIEANGGIAANSVSTFHPLGNRMRRSKKTSKRNSTNTLGYIEVNQVSQMTSSPGYTTLRQSNGSSIVGYTSINQRTSINAVTEEPSNSPVERQADTNNLLSSPDSSIAGQNIQTNTNDNTGYITIHN